MSDLRSRIIRAAYVNPDLQPHLLPLLREAAATVPSPEALARDLSRWADGIRGPVFDEVEVHYDPRIEAIHVSATAIHIHDHDMADLDDLMRHYPKALAAWVKSKKDAAKQLKDLVVRHVGRGTAAAYGWEVGLSNQNRVNVEITPKAVLMKRQQEAQAKEDARERMRLERERVEKEVLSLSDYLDNPNEAWVASGRDRKVYLNQVAKVIGLIAAKAGFKTQATLHSDQVDITVSKDDKSAMLRVGLYFRYDSPGYTGGKHIAYLKGVAKDSNGKYQDVEEYDLRSYGIPSLLAKIVRGR